MRSKLITCLAALLFALPAMAENPRIPNDINFELPASDTQWHIITKQNNTPVLRFYTYQGTSAWSSLGWSSKFKYSKTDSSTGMAEIAGTSYTNYIDFQAVTNSFSAPVDKWYCTVLLSTGVLSVSQASGLLTIERAPELNSSPIINAAPLLDWARYRQTNTLNYGPYKAGSNMTLRAVGSTNEQYYMDVVVTNLIDLIDLLTFSLLTNDVTNAVAKLNATSNRVVVLESQTTSNINNIVNVSNTASTALQPANTNNWQVGSHAGFLTVSSNVPWSQIISTPISLSDYGITNLIGDMFKTDTNGWIVSTHAGYLTVGSNATSATSAGSVTGTQSNALVQAQSDILNHSNQTTTALAGQAITNAFLQVQGINGSRLAQRGYDLSGHVVAWGTTNWYLLQVPAFASQDIVKISAGGVSAENVTVLNSSGCAYTWGCTDSYATNVPVDARSQVIDVSGGDLWSLALRNDGRVVAWGWNDGGQQNVPSAASNSIIKIAAGMGHALALRSDGKVVAWGNNNNGQTDVPPLASNSVVAIAAGWSHSLALRSDGTIIAWGNNTGNECDVPVTAINIIAIAANELGSLALCSDGRVIAWGTSAANPPALTGVIAISAGYDHYMALKSDGSVFAWGNNTTGETNVPASAGQSVIGICAGMNFSYALVASNTMGATVFKGAVDLNTNSLTLGGVPRTTWPEVGEGSGADSASTNYFRDAQNLTNLTAAGIVTNGVKVGSATNADTAAYCPTSNVSSNLTPSLTNIFLNAANQTNEQFSFSISYGIFTNASPATNDLFWSSPAPYNCHITNIGWWAQSGQLPTGIVLIANQTDAASFWSNIAFSNVTFNGSTRSNLAVDIAITNGQMVTYLPNPSTNPVMTFSGVRP